MVPGDHGLGSYDYVSKIKLVLDCTKESEVCVRGLLNKSGH